MANPPCETGSRLRAPLARTLLAAYVLGLPLTGCGFFSGRSELSESKRVSTCRWEARQACHELAKQDESLDVEECISERAWQCAIDKGDAAD